MNLALLPADREDVGDRGIAPSGGVGNRGATRRGQAGLSTDLSAGAHGVDPAGLPDPRGVRGVPVRGSPPRDRRAGARDPACGEGPVGLGP